MEGREVGILTDIGALLYVKLSILTSRAAGMSALSFFPFISIVSGRLDPVSLPAVFFRIRVGAPLVGANG